MSEQKKMGDIFVVQVTNRDGGKAFYCETPQGDGFCEKFCMETRFFKTWASAKMKANELNKYGSTIVLKMQNIINDPKLAESYGLTMGKNSLNKKDMYFIIGYSAEGVKHWIHFDGPTFKYFPDNQEAGACLWKKEQVEEAIKRFESDETMPIRNFTSEKINP